MTDPRVEGNGVTLRDILYVLDGIAIAAILLAVGYLIGRGA